MTNDAGMDLDAYLGALASREPAPGGGSAATLVGALAAALCAMVARITAAAPKHAAVHADAEAIAVDADALRARFLELRPLDEAAFAGVVAAQALPRATDDERAARTAALQRALAHAAEVPLDVAGEAVATFALAERTAALGNAHLMSDVACALHFARAALAAAGENVRVNHRFLRDEALVAAQTERLATLDAQAATHDRAARAIVDAAG
jgi:formiminotetrahydrofolate cyclodeaminase